MATDTAKCIVYTYNQRSIATSRPATLKLALVKAHLLFPELLTDFSLLLEMNIAGVQAEILEDAWSSPRLWKESVGVQVRLRTPVASGSGSRIAEGERGEKREEVQSVEGKGKEVCTDAVVAKVQGPVGGSASGKKKALKKKKAAAAAASQGGLLAARNGGQPTMTPEAFSSEFGALDPYTPVSIHVTGPPGDVAIKARANMSFSRVFEAYSNESEAPMDTFHCYWRGMKLVGKDSFIVLLKRFPDLVVNLSEDQSFKVVTVQKGGNPHLYFSSPIPLPSVAVALSLVPQWCFSSISPLVPFTRSKAGSSAHWTISLSTDGILTESSSPNPLSYLSWEADALPAPPSLLSADPSTALHPSFNPSLPLIDPSNAILLPFPDLIPYLEFVLARLSLPLLARTDFLAYWLPALLQIHGRGEQIALRFVEQELYGASARLDVEPVPDIVTRVFMLFRGVDESELPDWEEARERVESVDWAKVVGVREEAMDENKFRVLEWGGMEALYYW